MMHRSGQHPPARLIEIARSQLRIIDRQGLEAAACICYRIVKKAVDSVLTDQFT
jgi:hypothetical protein